MFRLVTTEIGQPFNFGNLKDYRVNLVNQRLNLQLEYVGSGLS